MLVSMLVALCAVSGRLGLVEIFIFIICFNLFWPLNFHFMEWLRKDKWGSDIEVHDSIGGNYVYLFAGTYAILVSVIINVKPGNKGSLSGSRQSAFIGMIGTGIAFAASPFTGFNAATVAGLYEYPLNVYFTLTSSVVMTYASSAIFGNYKVGVREGLVGVLGGVAIVGAVASYINNIGACLAVGAVAGFVSGFWLRVVHPRINAANTIDQLGIFGPIFVNAFLGAFVLAPALFGAYKSEGLNPAELNMAIMNERTSTFYLAIFGATLLVGLVGGAITGLLILLSRDPDNDHVFTKVVSPDFGLYNDSQPQANDHHGSAGNLRDKEL